MHFVGHRQLHTLRLRSHVYILGGLRHMTLTGTTLLADAEVAA